MKFAFSNYPLKKLLLLFIGIMLSSNAYSDVKSDLSVESLRLEKAVVKLKDIENKWFALITLSRVMDDADRPLIQRFIDKASQDAEALSFGSKIVAARILRDEIRRDFESDFRCPACRGKILQLGLQLTELEIALSNYQQMIRSYATRMQSRAMIAKRAPDIIRKTDVLLANASRKVSPTQHDAEKLRNALRLQDEAKAELLNRHVERSLRLTLKARDIVNTFNSLSKDTSEENLKKRSISTYASITEEIIEKLTSQASFKDAQSQRILFLASDENNLCRESIKKSDYSSAFSHAKQARTYALALLKQNEVTTDHSPHKADAVMARIASINSLVSLSNNSAAKSIMAKSLAHKDAALVAKSRKQPRMFFAELDIALRFAIKAADLAAMGNTVTSSLQKEGDIGIVLQKRAAALATSPKDKDDIEKASILLSSGIKTANASDIATAQTQLLAIISQLESTRPLQEPSGISNIIAPSDTTVLFDESEKE